MVDPNKCLFGITLVQISDFLSVCVDEAYTHTRTRVRNDPFETTCRLVDAVLSFETENKYSEMGLTVTFRGYSRITQIDIPRITFALCYCLLLRAADNL